MAQSSAPADNVPFQSSAWRDLFAGLGDGILDARSDATRGYPITLPASGNEAQIGTGTSRVAGFLHSCVGPEPLTVAAASGQSRTDTIVVRYDPAFSTDPRPCRLVVVPGTPGAGAPTLDTAPPGVQDMPLYNVTRAPGQTLQQATVTDRRKYAAAGSSIAPDIGVGNVTPAGGILKPGRRAVTLDAQGKGTVAFAEPFPNGLHSVPSLNQELASGAVSDMAFVSGDRSGFTLRRNGLTGGTITVHFLAVGY